MKRALVISLVLLTVVWGAEADALARSPNVIIFFADDLGIGDVGSYGCRDIETPNIDALARSGIRFTNYYCAAPICAPSRGGLLTGRYPTRAGMSTRRNIPSIMGSPGVATEEVFFSEIVKSRGYATAAFGKWHLGSTFDTQPNAQGFDTFVGHHASCVDSYSHWYYASEPYYHDLYRNREEIFEDGVYLAELMTREAKRFIDQHRQEPFLIYMSYNTPHYPMVGPGRFNKKYAHLPYLRRIYAALVAGIDESIGQVMAHLRKQGLDQDTFVFFSSDNGVANESKRGEGGGSNAPHREYKRSLFDGGIRMPAIVSWPGTVAPNQTRDQLTIAMDLLPTIAQISGAELPTDRVIDGKSWVPLLKDAGAPGHETLFFEWNEQHAVRQGKWKVVRNGLIDMHISRQNRATGDDYVFLADIEADPGERTNLAKQHPEIAAQLLKLHDEWRASIQRDRAGQPRPQ